ncbi:hypothetical protein Tco_0155941 [Tanacetum coccineum]
MVPTKKVDKTPYELSYGKVPNLSYLKVWGCEALVKRDTPDKLEQRSDLISCISIVLPKGNRWVYYFLTYHLKTKLLLQGPKGTHRAPPKRYTVYCRGGGHSLGVLMDPLAIKTHMLDSESNTVIDLAYECGKYNPMMG